MRLLRRLVSWIEGLGFFGVFMGGLYILSGVCWLVKPWGISPAGAADWFIGWTIVIVGFTIFQMYESWKYRLKAKWEAENRQRWERDGYERRAWKEIERYTAQQNDPEPGKDKEPKRNP